MIPRPIPVNIAIGLLRTNIQRNEEDNTRAHCPIVAILFLFLLDESEYSGTTHTAWDLGGHK